jgi:hypothetical protein
MARLTFPFGTDGLLVPALVSPSTADLQASTAQGRPPPASVHARGTLDSGCTLTAVVPRVLSALQATPGRKASTQTAAGRVPVICYEISFSIYRLGGGPLLTRPDWQVTSLSEDLPDVDVLFGLDLLREITLTVDGPGGWFALDF